MKFRLYREFFRALGNQSRFAIVQLLRERPHYVGEIVDELKMEQSRVSHNLGCLLNCGFVQWEWQGKNKVYRLHPDLIPILSAIDRHITKYAPALNSCQVLECESKPVVVVAKSAPAAQSQSRRRRK
ncbi:MAG TPA: metalloregulator ArsR/SmtB family transcription factor [Candidatus Angelobacter sp.]|nr:metalloregulator ArsR/SmtB family transcription factor [Candidatus Angelobacter sp.]